MERDKTMYPIIGEELEAEVKHLSYTCDICGKKIWPTIGLSRYGSLELKISSFGITGKSGKVICERMCPECNGNYEDWKKLGYSGEESLSLAKATKNY